MGYFKELDIIIQERTEYDPETRANEAAYLQLRDEIGMHLEGTLVFDQLSPIAQEVVRNWESMVEEMAHKDINLAEQGE